MDHELRRHLRHQADGVAERAECPECRGTGTVSVIVGDEATGGRCPSCVGTGLELTRDDFVRLAPHTATPQCRNCDWELVRSGGEYFCQHTGCARFGLRVNDLGHTQDEQADANEAWEIRRAS